MKKTNLLLFLIIMSGLMASGQQPGDTLIVNVFKYGSSSRDTLLAFPAGNITFEKIIMKYNMRCKNALVSTQSAPDQGCGEWDYSCNTFIVDSSKIEEVLQSHPSHTITGFAGTTFHYALSPLYDYYRYSQTDVILDSVISESQYKIDTGIVQVASVLKTDEKSGRTQVLYTAQELIAAGFSAGAIDGMMLYVTNTGGTAGFMKVGLQHDSSASLSAGDVLLTGFTNVYNSSYTFVNGVNRIQFHTPFVWDGLSNLIFEISFTNTVPGNPVVLLGDTSSFISALTSNNSYSIDLGMPGIVRIDSSFFSTINNEITVTFWSYGDADLLPANTSILYGWSTNQNQRQLNFHLPWGNGSVYFDCGFSGTYDRIYKSALPDEYKGRWNHWAFTKNASTGNMNIYLNGTLWHSGTGLTKSITLMNLLLGNNPSGTSNYKGKIREFTIWDKALPLNEIEAWMNIPVTSNHPSYSNLVAYYKVDEGNGSAIGDSKNNMVSTGNDFRWCYERGDRITNVFTESSLRPALTLLRGSYVIDTIIFFAWDSVQRTPETVREYAISPAPAGTLKDDDIVLVSASSVYSASPLSFFDGDADTLLYVQPVVADDSVQITSLSYYKRYPWYNEIMSFVTPYGKGLDLGVKGKTWYFDVTDFAPLLTGNKRFMMTGGVWQEELDIDFWFIVGTPPRDVIGFDQLWQGYARKGQASIASINNNTRFAPVSIPLHGDGEGFKVRGVITGHGSEGEFHQNGGAINHYLSVNSTINNFAWQITEECSFNPVFPQGGTWVYDRQGWCPGQYSLLKEMDVTSLVTPGDSATFDYNCSSPPVPNGDYRYLVAIQLVTYGAANHLLDASVLDVTAPSDKVLHSRKNPVCANPAILVQNTGSTAITSMEITYWLNQSSVKQNYTWTGNMGFLDSALIVLPTGSLWDHGLLLAGNVFNVEINTVNGVSDDYFHNNSYKSKFTVTDNIPGIFVVEIKTNNYPGHNSYSIVDEAGVSVPGTSNLAAPNTIYRDTLALDGCFTLKMTDTGGDGLQWWANTAQGSGYARIRSHTGALIKTFQPDFGGGFEYSFSTYYPVSVEESEKDNSVIIYPNPASDRLNILSGDQQITKIEVFDLPGQRILILEELNSSFSEVNISGWMPGLYVISVETSGGKVINKIVKN